MIEISKTDLELGLQAVAAIAAVIGLVLMIYFGVRKKPDTGSGFTMNFNTGGDLEYRITHQLEMDQRQDQPKAQRASLSHKNISSHAFNSDDYIKALVTGIASHQGRDRIDIEVRDGGQK
jgi:hypothetical protein